LDEAAQEVRRPVRAAFALAALLAACAAPDTLVVDEPRTATEFAIAPYEFHEECATLQRGDRIDYRWEAQAPVAFQIYYKEGITFISTVSRDDVRESSGVFSVPAARRYCVRWDAGQQGALVDFRIRVLRPNST
jgi:hypothetical protein